MKDNKGDVVIEGDRATITFRRMLRHSRERVWQAITDPKELSLWLLQAAAIDPRVGGSIEYVSAPTPIVWYGKVVEWDPPRIYEHEFNTDPDPRFSEHVRMERTIARWELEDVGEGTLLTLTFRGFTREVATGFAPGTHAFLDRLQALLAGEPLPDWLQRFEELRSSYWSA